MEIQRLLYVDEASIREVRRSFAYLVFGKTILSWSPIDRHDAHEKLHVVDRDPYPRASVIRVETVNVLQS
jgi:hypothetical protein